MGEFWIAKEQGRLFVEAPGEDWTDWTEEAAARISKVFGVVGICVVDVFSEDSFEAISANVNRYIQEHYGGDAATTFKVEVKRANKQYPMTSMELASALGGNDFGGLSRVAG